MRKLLLKDLINNGACIEVLKYFLAHKEELESINLDDVDYILVKDCTKKDWLLWLNDNLRLGINIRYEGNDGYWQTQ
jgi:hypothetical protein